MPALVIIINGVSRGIGRAIAEELQSRGTAVVGAARDVAAIPESDIEKMRKNILQRL